MKNKVALVAGSSAGLGRAVALELAHEGARVAICARNRERLFRTAEEIRQEARAEVLPLIADVSVEGDVLELIDQTLERFDRVDILVCNAGGPPGGTVEDFTAEQWQQALELNLLSTINLCRAAVRYMRRQRWGRIINITSISAKQPIDGLILSNTARAGVLGFSKTLANELAGENITVNCVCPGYTRTERVQELARSISRKRLVPVEEVYQQWQASIPMGRMGEPEELAALVAFLASERAGYITGTAIQVDGGYIKGLW